MLNVETERLITEAHSALEDLAYHFRNLAVVSDQAQWEAHRQSTSAAAPPVGRIDWGILVRSVGWKPSRAGFSAYLGCFTEVGRPHAISK